MQAIEFLAELKEDNTIKVPKKYAGVLNKKVRIIILVDEKPSKIITVDKKKGQIKKKVTKKFSAFKVNTKGLKVKREDANVRSNLL